MYKNDFVTSIISTNVRNVLNDSFGLRTELAQKAYDKSIGNCQQRHSPAMFKLNTSLKYTVN